MITLRIIGLSSEAYKPITRQPSGQHLIETS